MSSQIAISKFMTDLAMHFPKKHESPGAEKAWLQSMVATLRGYSDGVLREAAQHIIDKRKDRFFPLPSELKDACDAVQRIQTNITRAEALPQMQLSIGDEWSFERVKLAYDLLKSSMGKEAVGAQPCWVLSLWNFARKHQRLPQGQEIERCKKDAKDFDQAYSQCVRGNAGLASKALEGLGASMLAKREKLRAEVLGR